MRQTHPAGKASNQKFFDQSRYRGFAKVDYPEPHIGRAKQMLAQHPELKTLFGNNPWSVLHIVGLVTSQIVIAALLSHQPWWLILVVAWCVGAFLNHSLFVMIHEATHNLVLKGSVANRWIGMLANLPIIFPAAMGFRTFHLLHHRYQGEFDRDADLAGPVEARLVGNSAIRKTIWFLFFGVIEGVVRPARLKHIKVFDSWGILNLAIQLVFCALIVGLFGWSALAYMAASMMFSIGLHPVGARWIQEHYTVVPGQETYSYYGPLNWTCYNVGYHNEHHDLMMVPWSRLPKVKQMAPEFYDSLYSHRSWTGLLLKFIFDPKLSLYSRVVRPSREERESQREATPQSVATDFNLSGNDPVPAT